MKLIVLFLAVITTEAMAKTIEIKMLNTGKDGAMIFEPAFIKAEVGDSVKFTPTDRSHSSSSVFVPAGAQSWNGQVDKPTTVTLTKEGVYIYQCTPHMVMAMVGVIQVGKPTNLPAAKAHAEKMASAFAMNKERLPKYLSLAN